MATLTEEMLERLLRHEGGLVDHPSDPGGLTNMGISQRAYPHLDIRKLTREEAKALYRRDYWDRPRLGDIPDPGLAEQVFDLAVNGGSGRAFRLLHRTMGTPEAPMWTPPLREALQKVVHWEPFRQRFLQERLRFYQRLVRKNPKLGVFLKGWTRRAQAVAAH